MTDELFVHFVAEVIVHAKPGYLQFGEAKVPLKTSEVQHLVASTNGFSHQVLTACTNLASEVG